MGATNTKERNRARLLIRPDAGNYANRQDYLMQLAAANMLRGPRDLVHIFGKSYAKLTSMSSDALNLLIAGDVSAEKVTANIQLMTKKGLGVNARVCPDCVALKQPPHPHFNFSLPIPCQWHQIMPIDECPSCDTALSYLRRDANYCECGFNLAEAARVSIPKWLIRFLARYAGWKKTMPRDSSYVELATNYARTGLVVRTLLTKFPNDSKRISTSSWIKLREFLAMEKFVLESTAFRDFLAILESDGTNEQRKAVYGVLKSSRSRVLIKDAKTIERRYQRAREFQIEPTIKIAVKNDLDE